MGGSRLDQWAVVIEYYHSGGEPTVGEPFVHWVKGNREAARAVAMTEALAVWGQHKGMKRRKVKRALKVSPDQWLIEVEGNWDVRSRWVRVSVAEPVALPFDRPWRS